MKNVEERKEDLLKLFNSEFAKSMENSKNINNNQTYNVAYRNIIDETSKFIKNEFGITDSMATSVIFEYMLWNVYFSKHNCYVFSQKGRVNNRNNYGADIMRGRGVCLNIAWMLNDLLNNAGISSYFAACKLKKTEEEFFESVDIQRNIEMKNSLLNIIAQKTILNIITEKLGNHAVVLVEKDDDLFIVDPTNLLFLKFTDFLTSNELNRTIECILKPFVTLVATGMNPEELLNILLKTDDVKNKNSEYLWKDNIEELYEKNIDLCEKNIPLLKDFHNQIYDDIDVVCKTLKK